MTWRNTQFPVSVARSVLTTTGKTEAIAVLQSLRRQAQHIPDRSEASSFWVKQYSTQTTMFSTPNGTQFKCRVVNGNQCWVILLKIEYHSIFQKYVVSNINGILLFFQVKLSPHPLQKSAHFKHFETVYTCIIFYFCTSVYYENQQCLQFDQGCSKDVYDRMQIVCAYLCLQALYRIIQIHLLPHLFFFFFLHERKLYRHPRECINIIKN